MGEMMSRNVQLERAIKQMERNGIPTVYGTLTMSSVELVRMAEEGAGTVRHVCQLLASGVPSEGIRDFRLIMAVNEHILASRAKQRMEERTRLCDSLAEVIEAGRKAAAERQVLMERMGDRDDMGELVVDRDEGDNACIRIGDEKRMEEFAREEQLIVDGYQQAVAVLTDVESAGRPQELKNFDRARMSVRIYRLPWLAVPQGVGGGMLLAALPFFTGVPEGALRMARQLQAQEEQRTGADPRKSLLAWQGLLHGVP